MCTMVGTWNLALKVLGLENVLILRLVSSALKTMVGHIQCLLTYERNLHGPLVTPQGSL
jgi:hypothetical protein